MICKGIAYLGISILTAFAIPFVIVLIIEHQSKLEVIGKMDKKEKQVRKLLQRTRLFIDRDFNTYFWVSDIGKALVTILRYKFDRDTDHPRLDLGLEKYNIWFDDFYDNVKEGVYFPIYKDYMSFYTFLRDQERYIKNTPKYFWYGGSIFKIISKTIDGYDEDKNRLTYLMHIRMLDAKNILNTNQKFRFIDFQDEEIERHKGDKDLKKIEWVWDENDVTIYILNKIYQKLETIKGK